MKALFVKSLDVCFHTIFWIGLPFFVLSLGEFSSPRRAIRILTSRIDSASPIESCRGSVTLSPLLNVQYLVFVEFQRSRLSREDAAYFHKWSDRTAGFFWDTLEASLRVSIFDEAGRAILPAIEDDVHSHLIIGSTNSGQSIGVLDNARMEKDKIIISYSIETNCEKLLSYQPRIRLLATAKKEILLARMGVAFLAISCPWILIKRRRRAVTKLVTVRRPS